MDKYIKCLTSANNAATESGVADFEFRQPREAIIFSQWMGAILPIDESNPLRLREEKGGFLPGDSNWLDDSPGLFFESLMPVNVDHLLERRYVMFVPPLTSVTTRAIIGKHEEFDYPAYAQIVRNIKDKGLSPLSVVLVEVDKEKHPKYPESFWEYVAGCYFRGEGYLVTRRSPGDLRGGGIPDVCAFKTSSSLNPLLKRGFINHGGFLFELELPFLFGEVAERPAALLSDTDNSSVVVEAKTRGGDESKAEDQLTYRGGKGGYLEDGHFDEGYIVGPDFSHNHKVGVISNTPDGKLLTAECKRKTYAYIENKNNVFHRVERLIKLVLIRNMPLNRLLGLCRNNPLGEVTFRGFLDEVATVSESMTVDDMCSLVQQEMRRRAG